MQVLRPTIGIYQPLLRFSSGSGMLHLQRHLQLSPLRYFRSFQPIVARHRAIFPLVLLQPQHLLPTVRRSLLPNRTVQFPPISFDSDLNISPAKTVADGEIESTDSGFSTAMTPKSGSSDFGLPSHVLPSIAEPSTEPLPQAKIAAPIVHSSNVMQPAANLSKNRAFVSNETTLLADDSVFQNAEKFVESDRISPSVPSSTGTSTQSAKSTPSKKSSKGKPVQKSPAEAAKRQKKSAPAKAANRLKKSGKLAEVEALVPPLDQSAAENFAPQIMEVADTVYKNFDEIQAASQTAPFDSQINSASYITPDYFNESGEIQTARSDSRIDSTEYAVDTSKNDSEPVEVVHLIQQPEDGEATEDRETTEGEKTAEEVIAQTLKPSGETIAPKLSGAFPELNSTVKPWIKSEELEVPPQPITKIDPILTPKNSRRGTVASRQKESTKSSKKFRNTADQVSKFAPEQPFEDSSDLLTGRSSAESVQPSPESSQIPQDPEFAAEPSFEGSPDLLINQWFDESIQLPPESSFQAPQEPEFVPELSLNSLPDSHIDRSIEKSISLSPRYLSQISQAPSQQIHLALEADETASAHLNQEPYSLATSIDHEEQQAAVRIDETESIQPSGKSYSSVSSGDYEKLPAVEIGETNSIHPTEKSHDLTTSHDSPNLVDRLPTEQADITSPAFKAKQQQTIAEPLESLQKLDTASPASEIDKPLSPKVDQLEPTDHSAELAEIDFPSVETEKLLNGVNAPNLQVNQFLTIDHSAELTEADSSSTQTAKLPSEAAPNLKVNQLSITDPAELTETNDSAAQIAKSLSKAALPNPQVDESSTIDPAELTGIDYSSTQTAKLPSKAAPNLKVNQLSITDPAELTELTEANHSPPKTEKPLSGDSAMNLKGGAKPEQVSGDLDTVFPEQSSVLPTVPGDSAFPEMPGGNRASPQGYSVGGQVILRQTPTGQPIASSDTVPAMLTPGEFVINVQDAQKHLPLLQHLNQGGSLDDAPIPPAEEAIDSGEGATSAGQFSAGVIAPLPAAPAVSRKPKGIQRKRKGQPIQPAVSQISGTVFSEHSPGASRLLPIQLNAAEETESEDAIAYSLPSIIHRSPSPAAPPRSSSQSPSMPLPKQWNSVEDLLGFQSTFGAAGDEWMPPANTASLEMPTIVHRQDIVQEFEKGGEVSAPATATEIPTETITASNEKENGEDAEQKKEGEIENLAQEIYARLRLRLEIERERQGVYNGRLPW
ncbi:hypothetical protein IFO70_21170 [Phormidium tenue FACHB-886]|nr:hypothetical protein [Phormidium tenue FACHB-886]